MSLTVERRLDPIADRLRVFEERLEATVAADLGPMAKAMEHIVKAGGKRLRPALVLLSSSLGEPEEDHAYALAMAVEFIHTATLIHDDLIDDAPTRRGLATIHAMLGANPAIIVGDYYFAKGANLMASVGMVEIDEVLSRCVMTICMGELLQLTSKRFFDQSVDDYYRKIERKTATLLSACTYCGGIVGRVGPERAAALERYGSDLGMAFQIADDLLDYVANAEELGKPVGADLRQGTVTLPLMYARDDHDLGPQLRRLLERERLEDADYEEVVRLVRASDAVERAEKKAHEFADRARKHLTVFPESAARATLEGLCDYVVERRV
ncbi:MAG: polyprenyl synthetase family protein [Candidatus Dormibacteria bacterium]